MTSKDKHFRHLGDVMPEAEQSKASLEEFAANHLLKKEQVRIKRMENALMKIANFEPTVPVKIEFINILNLAKEALKDE